MKDKDKDKPKARPKQEKKAEKPAPKPKKAPAKSAKSTPVTDPGNPTPPKKAAAPKKTKTPPAPPQPSLQDLGHQIVVQTTPIPGAQPPAQRLPVRVKKPKTSSAGLPAVQSALGHAFGYMRPGQALKTMFKVNQKGGFDCPGCAWPDPDDDRSSLGEYCENGIKAIAEEAQRNTIDADFFALHAIADLQNWSDFELGKSGRLAQPLHRAPGASHYRPISWDDAFQLIGRELNALSSPDEAVFYTSGRTSNEAAFLYQLFVRAFGTNNLPDCSNLCHESSSVALNQTLGFGKGSVKLEDFAAADLIIILGQNPGTNHPRMLSALEQCKAKGGKIIAINPLKEAGLLGFRNPQRVKKMLGSALTVADLYLQVKINGDIALLKALMLLLLYEEKKRLGSIFDMDFIVANTTGYEAFAAHLQQHDFNALEAACGIKRAQLKKAAELIQKSQNIIACWAMGLTQHANGVANIQELVNLLLLKGSIGKPGAGLCPVRGHSNVQGDRTMGITVNPKPEFLDRLEQTFGIKAPRQEGLSTVDAIQAMYHGRAKVFLGLGGNFLSASPDTEVTAQALQRCRLTVQVSTKLNRSHLITGEQALILPCLARTDRDVQANGEQLVSTENSMGVVQSSQGILPPSSVWLRSEPAIVAGIAKATLGSRTPIDWDALVADYDQIRAGIAQVLPDFVDYNQKVRQPGGFYLSNPLREGRFDQAPAGKATFTLNELPPNDLAPGEFLLMTIRSHDQFNTTIYGLHDRYRGIHQERRVVLMNRADIAAAQLKNGQVVTLSSHYEGQRRVAKDFIVVGYDIPSGCLATYFPEGNVLFPVDQYAKGSKTPIYKSLRVRLEV